jgi:hypothetical protein
MDRLGGRGCVGPSLLSLPPTTTLRYASRTFTRLWRALLGGERKRPSSPESILHDPFAGRAKDLDDPFIDPKAQGRIGKLIGDQSKQPKPIGRQPPARR